MKISILFFALCTALYAAASQPRKVLIIGIDGVRTDALQQANTPNIDALIASGFYTYESWHEGITVSGPSWSTIMCGVEFPKHGVTSNSYSGSNYNQYPYFTRHAKDCLPNLYQVQIVQWAPMSDNVYNDAWDQKIKVCDGCGANSVSAAQTQLANPNLDVLFVYFDECDLTGHSIGFNPANPTYINAIQTVDGHIGSILNALYSRPNYANEDWVILLTTDHGGIGTGHGGNTNSERKIWWIGSGNNPISKQLTNVQDPGSYAIGNHNAAVALNNPSQADIAATALDHLFRGTNCNPSDPSWNLDGTSWLDSLHSEAPAGVEEVDQAEDIKMFPNPATDILSLWFENANNEDVTYVIYDMNGREMLKENEVTMMNANKLNVDVRRLRKGNYLLKMQLGGRCITKRFTMD
ncbi:MAG: T9SS C-terminal target domain-containing protein [Flavobacteriia bacterium]|nr:T9SS C-terminal target domain-containing protein [Flavobacteriia bacterium]